MIERGRVGYLWDEDNQRGVYLLGHRTTSEEGSDCCNDIIPHYWPEIFVESNGKSIGTRGLQFRHVKQGGFNFLRSRNVAESRIIFLRDDRSDKVFQMNWEVYFLRCEEMYEIIKEMMPD